MARPRTKDRPAIVAAICRDISDGASLRSACTANSLSLKQFNEWLAGKADDATEFRAQYAQARDERAHWLAEQALDAASGTDKLSELYERAIDEEGDTLDPKIRGKVVSLLSANAIQRDRLRVDTIKWFASKLAPKSYGEKVQMEHAGTDGQPIQVQVWQFGGREVSF